MPQILSTAHVSTSAPNRSDARDFDRLRVHSYPAGHALLPAARAGDERPLWLIWLRGGGEIRQHGRTVVAPAGSLCFLPRDAAVWLSHVEFGAVAIELPFEVEARARERVAAAVGTAITVESGAAAFLRSFLDTLDHQPPSYRPDYPSWVQTCVCDITDRVLAECFGTQSSPAERSILAAKDYVASHLADPDLTPHRVAHAAAVSLRTLNRLFAAEDDSVCGWIRRHRLERCREDLIDPGKADRSIGQIAGLWGFPDAAHFSRAFKEAFGCSPRAFRAAGHPGRLREARADRAA